MCMWIQKVHKQVYNQENEKIYNGRFVINSTWQVTCIKKIKNYKNLVIKYIIQLKWVNHLYKQFSYKTISNGLTAQEKML